jgi:HEAT repeat protein
MAIDPGYEVIYPLFGAVIASQIAETWTMLAVALERPAGRPFTEEEVTDLRSRETRLLVEALSLEASGPLFLSSSALSGPRISVQRNRRLACLGPAYIYRAINKCLDDAENDGRVLPGLAACVLVDAAYAVDPDGSLLPKPGARAAPRGRAERVRAARGQATAAADGASLIRALRFADERVQYAAAIALGRMGPPEPFDGADEVVLVLARAVGESGPTQVLVVEEDPSIRNEIMGKLRGLDVGVAHAPTARDGLARAVGFPPFDVVLASPALEKDESTRWLLDKMVANPRSRPLAVGILTSDSKREQDKQTYGDAANVKGFVSIEDSGQDLRKVIDRIASQRATPIMSRKLAEELSVLAAETLCQIDPHLAKINGMVVEQAAEACIASLENRSDEVRRPCIDALGRFGIVQALEKLMALAADATQTLEVRVSATRALAQMRPESLKGLLDMAENEKDYILRYLASEAFGRASTTPEKLKEFLEALRPEILGRSAMPTEEAPGF